MLGGVSLPLSPSFSVSRLASDVRRSPHIVLHNQLVLVQAAHSRTRAHGRRSLRARLLGLPLWLLRQQQLVLGQRRLHLPAKAEKAAYRHNPASPPRREAKLNWYLLAL